MDKNDKLTKAEIKTLIIALSIVLPFLFYFGYLAVSSTISTSEDYLATTEQQEKFLENFHAIDIGMEYEDVEHLLGQGEFAGKSEYLERIIETYKYRSAYNINHYYLVTVDYIDDKVNKVHLNRHDRYNYQ